MTRFINAFAAYVENALEEFPESSFVAHLADSPHDRKVFMQPDRLFGKAFSNKEMERYPLR